MKHLPEKVVMAAIILSCGFFAHTDPSAGEHKAKRTSPGKLAAKHQEVHPGSPAARPEHSLARELAARLEAP
ncbi:hypothetical protein GMST_11560 [Geomonas silvestris]|uniref:Uncharacterized protein n=1 Tax=Geomonas silvestris TaxID=2740184 RepID=A0A6V8MFQ4_9BACT|nr:hypothetical protein [Geomonas silvestris]GFO58831.1 hypothetical protein GMST_11560 [Geomonas silvestris]